jgi:hypothetical protein
VVQWIIALGREAAIGSHINILDVNGIPANADHILGKDHFAGIQRRLVPAECHTPGRYAPFTRTEFAAETHGELVAGYFLVVE